MQENISVICVFNIEIQHEDVDIFSIILYLQLIIFFDQCIYGEFRIDFVNMQIPKTIFCKLV